MEVKAPPVWEIPVIGLASCGLANWFNPSALPLKTAMPVDYPYREGLFAVIAVGTSMVPDGIRPNNLLFCDPNLPIEPGDGVYIERKDGTATVKRFLRHDDDWVYTPGWLSPDDKGEQNSYEEKIAKSYVAMSACVVIIRRKM